MYYYCDYPGCRHSSTTKGGLGTHKYYAHLHPELRPSLRRDKGTISLRPNERDTSPRNVSGFADRSFK